MTPIPVFQPGQRGQVLTRFCVAGLVLVSILAAGQAQTDDRGIAMTIYHDNLALVREVRSLDLKKGLTEVSFTDVPALIDPTSVHFTSLTAPGRVAVLEQNYEYDLVSPAKLLEKYIDRDIRVFLEDEKMHEGKLLSAREGDVVLSNEDGGITTLRGEAIRHVEYPALPEGLMTRPTLVWLVESDRAGAHQAEVSYLTKGISWHAEYVAVVNPEDTRLELGGWVSIDNQSGATYQNAELKLMAGEVHRVEDRRQMRRDQVLSFEAKAVGAAQFEERTFFEYHLYTLQRPATIKDRQMKQMSLFPNAGTPVRKTYTFDGSQNEKDVRVNVEFTNSQASGLGMPLPQGKLRVYKEDDDGSLQFVGEDLIDHTPRDEKVRVFLGNAFDIVGERKVADSRKITDRVREETIEVRLRNHKSSMVTVVVVEHLYGDWKIISSSADYRKKDARTIEFDVPVPKDQESVVTYTARYSW